MKTIQRIFNMGRARTIDPAKASSTPLAEAMKDLHNTDKTSKTNSVPKNQSSQQQMGGASRHYGVPRGGVPRGGVRGQGGGFGDSGFRPGAFYTPSPQRFYVPPGGHGPRTGIGQARYGDPNYYQPPESFASIPRASLDSSASNDRRSSDRQGSSSSRIERSASPNFANNYHDHNPKSAGIAANVLRPAYASLPPPPNTRAEMREAFSNIKSNVSKALVLQAIKSHDNYYSSNYKMRLVQEARQMISEKQHESLSLETKGVTLLKAIKADELDRRVKSEGVATMPGATVGKLTPEQLLANKTELDLVSQRIAVLDAQVQLLFELVSEIEKDE